MYAPLKFIELSNFRLASGKEQDLVISYQLFGAALHTAPIVLINHALTGNSSVTQWWNRIVGPDKVIDTERCTVISIDVPGNGASQEVEHLIFNYQDWCLADVGAAFAKALELLGIDGIEVGIGGSIGGALLWEMLVIRPELFKTIIPIAAHWCSSDWVMACCHIQEEILNTAANPVSLARKQAMTFYRTPQSLQAKFGRSKEAASFKVKAWLDHHGNTLKNRFTLPSYRLMNHLLSTIDAAAAYQQNIAEALKGSTTTIELVSIDSDGLFVKRDDSDTFKALKNQCDISHHIIRSIHGHDAFLIEADQVEAILMSVMPESLQSLKQKHTPII